LKVDHVDDYQMGPVS